MTARSCPGEARLLALLALDLTPDDEGEVRAHLSGCPSCGERVRAHEPSWLFVDLPRRTLPDDAWREVAAAVRRECAVPRAPRFLARLRAGLAALRPALLGFASGAAVLLVAAATGVLTLRPAEGPVGAVVGTVPPVTERDAVRPAWPRSAPPPEFRYLSNPRAEVAHVLVAGAEGESAVQVTMVIDETLADLF